MLFIASACEGMNTASHEMSLSPISSSHRHPLSRTFMCTWTNITWWLVCRLRLGHIRPDGRSIAPAICNFLRGLVENSGWSQEFRVFFAEEKGPWRTREIGLERPRDAESGETPFWTLRTGTQDCRCLLFFRVKCYFLWISTAFRASFFLCICVLTTAGNSPALPTSSVHVRMWREIRREMGTKKKRGLKGDVYERGK